MLQSSEMYVCMCAYVCICYVTTCAGQIRMLQSSEIVCMYVCMYVCIDGFFAAYTKIGVIY
jgi:hypothetical protein